MRQYDAAPEISSATSQERIAKLFRWHGHDPCGWRDAGRAKAPHQLIEDAINATRAAIEEGIVPGGGCRAAQSSAAARCMIDELKGGAKQGRSCFNAR